MNKHEQLKDILKMELTDEQVTAIANNWKAFYDDPEAYKNGIITDCVKRFLNN